LSEALPDLDLYAAFAGAAEAIAAAYEARDTASAVREIMALADRANQYIDMRKPWTLAKQSEKAEEVQGICTLGLNLFRVLMIYLAPVLPNMAAKARRFFHESAWNWASAATPLLGTRITQYEPLAARLDAKAVAQLVEPPPEAATAEHATAASGAASGDAASAASGAAPGVTPHAAPGSATVSLEDFLRIDLRVAKVLNAEFVAGADKLLKLHVDVGELGTREIFAGIRAAYDPVPLIGRHIVVVANLAPRKMRFGTSQGMMLAAGPGGRDIFLLSPDSGAVPGMRVK
jgi:methionyl-tRNA synthetase